MNLLIVGEGSIGLRRKMLLQEMGHTVDGIDLKNKQLLNPTLAGSYDAVFICLPPNQCVPAACYCADAKTPFFLEKPGASSLSISAETSLLE